MVELVTQAAAMFAVTNVDDILILTLYFGRAPGDRTAQRQIVLGQYLGFTLILTVSVLAAFGLRVLPEEAIAYLGLLPIALGIRAGLGTWRHRSAAPNDEQLPVASPSIGEIAGVTFSNGGDNIGVYVPVFATVGASGTVIYVAVFLILVAWWCFVGRFLATRPGIARALSRWGHILLPVVLITIGVVILVEGGAFGL